MKFLTVVAILSAAAMLVLPSSSHARDKEYRAKQLDLKIDGDLSEWGDSDVVMLNELKDVGDNLPDGKDYSGTGMIGWSSSDPGRIYFAVTITDDELQDIFSPDDNFWEDDSMEFMFDFKNYGNLVLWNVAANGQTISWSATKENTEWVVVNKGDQYIFEVAIDPTKDNPKKPGWGTDFKAEPGVTIGLAFQYNDCENGAREHQIGWTPGKAWDANSYGDLIFDATVVTAVDISAKLATTAIASVTKTQVDYTELAKDTDVMARIIDKTIAGIFPNEYPSSSLFSRDARGCEGIYLKGYGVVFMTSVGFSVAEQVSPQEESSPDGLWQQTQREMEGGASRSSAVTGTGVYDPEKVDQLKEELLNVIGTYGPNIRQLGSQENVVVAVRGTRGPIRVSVLLEEQRLRQLRGQLEEAIQTYQKLLKQAGSDAGTPAGLGSPEVPKVPTVTTVKTPKPMIGTKTTTVTTKSIGSARKTTGGYTEKLIRDADSFVNKGAGWATHMNISQIGGTRTTLIIRVSIESIMAYRDGDISLNDLMKQAELTQY